jgi:hypothetical protein
MMAIVMDDVHGAIFGFLFYCKKKANVNSEFLDLCPVLHSRLLTLRVAKDILLKLEE